MFSEKITKVAIISKSDSTGGGASRIASSLTQMLNQIPGIEAHHWAGLPGINADWYTFKLHGGRWLSLIQGVCSITSRAIGFPDFFTPELFIHLLSKKIDYDLYHFHDISFTFSPIALKWLCKRKPVIWTFHDCSPFTGGCISPMDCKALYTRCHYCPQLNRLPLGTKIDMTNFMQKYKKNMLANFPITPIMPSAWLRQECLKVVQPKIAPIVIPNFVDTDNFRLFNKTTIREILGLPKQKFIVLLSSTSINDERKGLEFALAALSKIYIKPFILAIGKIEKKAEEIFRGWDFYSTGYIYNDKLLAQYYAAADIFLFPTLADSFGLVAIETMACGTPCIAFATGGVPEIIDHDANGWLVKQKDVDGLAQGLKIAITEKNRLQKWVSYGLIKVQEKYNPQVFLDSHLELYSKAINHREEL